MLKLRPDALLVPRVCRAQRSYFAIMTQFCRFVSNKRAEAKPINGFRKVRRSLLKKLGNWRIWQKHNTHVTMKDLILA